jgi:hypothetical protein
MRVEQQLIQFLKFLFCVPKGRIPVAKITLTTILEKHIAAGAVIKAAVAEEATAHELEVAAAKASADAVAAGVQIEAHTAAALNPPEGPIRTITSDGTVYVGRGGAAFETFKPDHSDSIMVDDPDAPAVTEPTTEAPTEAQPPHA